MTPYDVAELVLDAGFGDRGNRFVREDAVVAVAVAAPESGWCAKSYLAYIKIKTFNKDKQAAVMSEIARLPRSITLTSFQHEVIKIGQKHGVQAFVSSADRGLFQINKKYNKDMSNAEAFDPWLSTLRAAQIYRNRDYNFTAWVAYNKGLHLKYMDRAREAVRRVLEDGLDHLE